MQFKQKMNEEYEAFKTLSIYTKVLVIFILMNPVIDVITSIGIREFGISLSVGMFLKGVFLLYTLIQFLGTPITRRVHLLQKLLLAAFALYGLMHAVISYGNFDLSHAAASLVNMAKTFYLPLLVLSLHRLIEKKDIPFLTRTLVLSAVFVAAIIALAMITGTDYNAYKYGKTGTVGWFYAANEVSALLGILTPLLIYFVLEKLKVIGSIKILLTSIYAFLYYQIGTKVVALSVIMTILYILILFILRKVKDRNYKVMMQVATLSILFVMSIGLVPVTPIGINLNLHNAMLQDLYKDNIDEENPETNENIKEDFGIDDLLDNNAALMSLVFSGRDEYFTVRKYIYDRSGPMEKLFGLTQFAKTDTGKIKSYIIEIDYFDIFFNFGTIGSLFYWVIVLGSVGCSVKRIFRNWKILQPGSVLPYYVCAVTLAFGIAMFAGHVFVSPSVSFYLAVIISILAAGTKIEEITA